MSVSSTMDQIYICPQKREDENYRVMKIVHLLIRKNGVYSSFYFRNHEKRKKTSLTAILT